MSLTDPSDDLDRIRSVREGSSENSSSPAILECPIDDCGRIIANGRDYLMHHVRQSSDEDHEGLRLNDELEIVQIDSGSSERDSPDEDDPIPSIEPESTEGAVRADFGPVETNNPSEPDINPASEVTW